MTTEAPMDEVVQDVERAAQMMDERKPSWWRRIVFKRLDMNIACDCIAGQAGLDWAELENDFDDRYPSSMTQPFAARETQRAWEDEVRKRKAAAR